MQILVLGKSHSAKILSQYFAQNKDNIVFTTANCEEANIVSLNLNNIDEIKEFIIANEVSFCIAADKSLANHDYASILQETECLSLCPDLESYRICSNISSGKKFAYKNKIQTQKFAVFEKAQAALDYIQTANFPIIISPDRYIETEAAFIAETKDRAKKQVEFLFQTGNKKIIIEDYIQGIEYTKYLASDGLCAIDLFETVSYFDEISTNNTNYVSKIKSKIENEIMPAFLDAFMEEGIEYQGILGVKFIIDKDNNVYFSSFKPFFEDIDAKIAVATISNLEDILYSCANGTLSQFAPNTTDNYALCTVFGDDFIFSCAKTMSRAVEFAIFDGADEKAIKEALKLWAR